MAMGSTDNELRVTTIEVGVCLYANNESNGTGCNDTIRTFIFQCSTHPGQKVL